MFFSLPGFQELKQESRKNHSQIQVSCHSVIYHRTAQARERSDDYFTMSNNQPVCKMKQSVFLVLQQSRLIVTIVNLTAVGFNISRTAIAMICGRVPLSAN